MGIVDIEKAKVIFEVNDFNISLDDLRAKYKRLVMENHPDRGGSDKVCAEINTAYGVLLDYKKDIDAILKRETAKVFILGDVKDLIGIYSGMKVQDIGGNDVDLDIMATGQTYITFNGCVEYAGVVEPFSELVKKNYKDVYSISIDLDSSAFGGCMRLQLYNKQVNINLDYRYMDMTMVLDKNIRVNFAITVLAE